MGTWLVELELKPSPSATKRTGIVNWSADDPRPGYTADLTGKAQISVPPSAKVTVTVVDSNEFGSGPAGEPYMFDTEPAPVLPPNSPPPKPEVLGHRVLKWVP
jgi:hypothetical protein